MNRNRLLLIGFIALALGAFVSLVVYRNLQSRTSSKTPPGEEVVVAADDLQVGHEDRRQGYSAGPLPER